MIFRRVLAAFLVFIFIASSLAAFLIFATSNTFFSAAFYEEDIESDAYDFLVNATVKTLVHDNEFIAENFTEADLRREIIEVFPESIYEKMVKQLISEMETLRQDPSRPITLELSTYRESLLTLAHNMSFKLFQSIPECDEGEIPEEGKDGLPTCIPPGVEYNLVAAPFSEGIEQSIYAAVPEQIQLDLNATVGEGGYVLSNVFQTLDTVKIIIYGILLILLVLIALLIWKPFLVILSYEGTAFLISGILGVLLSYLLYFLPSVISANFKNPLLQDDIRVLVDKIVELFSFQVQKGAYIFLALGAVLILTRLFMKKR